MAGSVAGSTNTSTRPTGLWVKFHACERFFFWNGYIRTSLERPRNCAEGRSSSFYGKKMPPSWKYGDRIPDSAPGLYITCWAFEIAILGPGERRSTANIKKKCWTSPTLIGIRDCVPSLITSHVWTGTTQAQAQENSSRFTRGLCLCLCLRRTRKPAFMVVKCGRKVRSAWALEMLTSSSSTVLCWSPKPRSIACTSEKPIKGTERRDQVTDITVWQRWVRYQKKKTRWVGLEGRGKEQMRESDGWVHTSTMEGRIGSNTPRNVNN